MGKQFVCLKCGNCFKLNIYLRRHVKKYHPHDDVNVIAPKLRNQLSYKYKCSICDRNFNFHNLLKSHERKTHSIGLENCDRIKTFKCPLCECSTKEKKDLLIHIESAHSLKITKNVLEFPSFEEFIQWKKCVERDTLSLYISNTGSKQTIKKLLTRHYYTCHRSGYYNTRGKGKRHLKTQGSKKINGVCPASIQVTESEDGKCNVTYIATHVGHQNDIHHLSLTINERENLAADIANKVPFQAILDKVRSSVPDSRLGRIHLLTKKDLYNIEKNKHIHLVCQFRDCLKQPTGTTSEISSADDLFLDTGNSNEREEIVNEIGEEENAPHSSLLQLRKKVRETLLQLADNVLTFTDIELEVVKEDITTLEAILKMVRNRSRLNCVLVDS